MAVFVFDIETVPDVELGRRVFGLHDLSDKQVGYVMQAKRREESGSEFLSLEQQRVVTISIAMRSRDTLRHGIVAPRYWEAGDADQAFRYNNYLSRYHSRHLDLMDVLSSYQGRARVSLEGAALLLGLPGKLGMSGEKVWDAYLDGQIDLIRNYCETDVLNTYLIYLRFEMMRGRLLPQEYRDEVARVREVLSQQAKPHFQEFLAAWQESSC